MCVRICNGLWESQKRCREWLSGIWRKQQRKCAILCRGYGQLLFWCQFMCWRTENIGQESVEHNSVAEAAGVFNTATNTITYAQNIYERMYPASTTKILTAYLAIKYGNLSDVVTISDNAVNLASDSSKCGLQAGDQMTLQDLLYGLMLRSGNDAAIAIAEHISGSVEAFVDLMNQEAQQLGATGSHFMNPNGLPDENHYTTVYDLYLIFQKALQDETFYQLISTSSYTTNYTAADGSAKTQDWSSTNQYKTGESKLPDGFTLVGGKTGTTGDAGFCLVLLTDNAGGQPVISIVLKADCKSNLYLMMNEILAGCGN
jgi:D-alanyl-D-alanine carboxypeptidase (penicillin-binding protein 5/6)